MSDWPTDRPVTYDSSFVWGWDVSATVYKWLEPGVHIEQAPTLAAGGGRYKQKCVVIGHESVYFGDMT